jgi:hypothetical protein
MKLPGCEATIQQMLEGFHLEPKESGKHKLLMDWRAKLAKEPHNLQLFQIDEIVRELRNRLKSNSAQPHQPAPAHTPAPAALAQV